MSEYVITTDNNSDLPEKYLKDHGVGCMYLSYSMDGKNYTHGNFLPEHEFYEAMRNGSMPTTAQVNPENAKALLEPYLKEGKDILHIAFSSALSGTYNSSRIAAEELMEDYPDRKIIVVDSLGASLGQGLLVYLAQEKKEQGEDMDPQGNTTSGFGVDKNGIENTLYELLLGEAETKDTIVKDVVENLDLIPSNINLSGAEIELVGIDDKEFILKGITDKLRRKYDYIILDCPPSLNMLTINALTAATSVLVPIQCEYYALEGLSQLIHTIDLVKERLNKRLKMEGVVFTMYDARTNLSLQVVENVKENLNQNIYKTIIPRNVRLAEAPSYGQPINIYDPRSAGAESYRLLAEEVLNREDN